MIAYMICDFYKYASFSLGQVRVYRCIAEMGIRVRDSDSSRCFGTRDLLATCLHRLETWFETFWSKRVTTWFGTWGLATCKLRDLRKCSFHS